MDPTAPSAAPGDPDDVPYVSVPGDLFDAVQDAVEAGSHAEGEAVALALEGALGLGNSAPGLTVDDVATAELTALARRAEDLLDAGDLPIEQATRVQAALNHMNPSQEFLDAISIAESAVDAAARPRDTASHGAQLVGLGMAQAPGDDLCGGLFDDGFDPESHGFYAAHTGGEKCYTFVEDTSTGHPLRVYYPSYWRGDGLLEPLVGQAMSALDKARGVYQALTGLDIGAVNVIFSMRNHNSWYGVTGSIPSRGVASSPCPITIFPLATGRQTAVMQRTVAHELFHCVAERMSASQGNPETTWDQDRWWVEGAGEYFSNVVYPEVNDEHKPWDHHFSGETAKLGKALNELNYHNVVFFQSYANQRGDGALIGLLESLVGATKPLEVMAANDGMDDVWARFLVDYAAGEVHDTDPGGPAYQATYFTNAKLTKGEAPVTFETEPFVARIHRLIYTEPDHKYHQTVTSGVPVSTVLREEVGNLAAWDDPLSGTLEHCGPFRLWTVPATSGRETATVNFDQVDEYACFTCPVSEADVTRATGRSFSFNVNETGTRETEAPRSPGALAGCIFYADQGAAAGSTAGPGDWLLVRAPSATAQEPQGGESQLSIALMDPDVLAPDTVSAQGSAADSVDGFPGAALYVNDDRQVQDRLRPWAHKAQRLDVVIGPIVHRIQVRGKIVHEEGAGRVLEMLRTLVDMIVDNQDNPSANDDGNAPPGGSDSSGSSGGGGSGGGSGGSGGSGGGSGSGGTFGETATATVDVEGETYTFTTVFVCAIGPQQINAHFAVDASGHGGGVVKADSATDVIWVQTRSPLESREGYRVTLSVTDPNLKVADGSFTFSGPATFHEDARDLGDPGRPAGDATVTMTC